MQTSAMHATQHRSCGLSVSPADQSLVGNNAPLLRIDDGLERIGNGRLALPDAYRQVATGMGVRRRHKFSYVGKVLHPGESMSPAAASKSIQKFFRPANAE